MSRWTPLLVAVAVLAACTAAGSRSGPTTAPPSAPSTRGTPSTASPSSTTPTPTSPAPISLEVTTAATATTAAAPTPTTSVARDHRYAATGPYDVGVIDTMMGDRPVTIWYPAEAGSSHGKAPATYDLRQQLPVSERVKIRSPDGMVFTMTAFNALPVARTGGPFPLVLFSHARGGFRTQSSFLTTHLASWGYVVAAPEHLSRDLVAVLTATLGNGQDDLADLGQTIQLVTSRAKLPAIASIVDANKIAVVGHSTGGSAAIRFAKDPAVSTYVAIAAEPLDADPTPTTAAAKPSLYLAASADTVELLTSMQSGFTKVPSPARLVVIGNATHLSFTDLCTLGHGRGDVLQIANSAGVSVPAGMLGQFADACSARHLSVEATWPLVDQVVTAHLRWAFGTDPAPIGLGPELTNGWRPIAVTVSSR